MLRQWRLDNIRMGNITHPFNFLLSRGKGSLKNKRIDADFLPVTSIAGTQPLRADGLLQGRPKRSTQCRAEISRKARFGLGFQGTDKPDGWKLSDKVCYISNFGHPVLYPDAVKP